MEYTETLSLSLFSEGIVILYKGQKEIFPRIKIIEMKTDLSAEIKKACKQNPS